MNRAIQSKVARKHLYDDASADDSSESSESLKNETRPIPKTNVLSRGKPENAFDDQINELDVVNIVTAKQQKEEGVGKAVEIDVDQVLQVELATPENQVLQDVEKSSWLDFKPPKESAQPQFETLSNLPVRFYGWKPSDDYALLLNVGQTNSVEKVHTDVKFSKNFSLEELEARFYAIAFNKHVFGEVRKRIRNLHPLHKKLVESNTLFSAQEDSYLNIYGSSDEPTLADFEDLLFDHCDIFLFCRSSRTLQKRWLFLKTFNLLEDQIATSTDDWPKDIDEEMESDKSSDEPSDEDSDMNSLVESMDSSDSADEVQHSDVDGDGEPEADNEECSNRDDDEGKSQGSESDIKGTNKQFYKELLMEQYAHDRSVKRKASRLDAELMKWYVLVNSLEMVENYVGLPEFDCKCLAALRGRYVCYYIYKKEVTFGRRTKCSPNIHIDLCKEGFAEKVSRFQGIIEANDYGDFWISNFGRRPICVNGLVCKTGEKLPLYNQNLVRICGLAFIFLTNDIVISQMRKESLISVEPGSLSPKVEKPDMK